MGWGQERLSCCLAFAFAAGKWGADIRQIRGILGFPQGNAMASCLYTTKRSDEYEERMPSFKACFYIDFRHTLHSSSRTV